jgi:hypothetical protein
LANREKDLRGATEKPMREVGRDLSKRIDEIRAELKNRGPEAVEKVERSLDDLKEDLQGSLSEVNGGFEDKLKMRRDEVGGHPLLEVGSPRRWGSSSE